MPLTPGTRLGPYEILAPIGAGGMGEVFRARDLRLERDVALKVLPEAFAHDSERLRRFHQEARAAGSLNHPNIVAVYDIGESDGATYVITELLEGGTLRDRLTGAPLPPRKAVEYAVHVARGLGVAHAKGITHRDIKPENLFVTRDGFVKILDFGLAKVAQPDAISGTSAPTEYLQTGAGVVLGTFGYMAPEQVRAAPVDARSDIFSLGAVLHEMLSGRRAFSGASAADVMSAILKEEPPELPAAVPAPLTAIVRRCLEKDPEERFGSARDLSFALESGAAESGRDTAPVVRRPAKWLRAGTLIPALALGVLLGVAMGLAGWSLGRQGGAVEPARFQPLTFRRGEVSGARLTGDGKTIVYSAAWDGKPEDLYTTLQSNPESRAMGMPRAQIAAVSRTGDMAIILHPQVPMWFYPTPGTLARAPLSGGAPREIADHVTSADWSPDGTQLAIVRADSNGHHVLEYPIGKKLFETPGFIYSPRVSPKGDLTAFIDVPVPWDGHGAVAVVDAAGRKRTLSAEYWVVSGIAWSADGSEIWFTKCDRGTNTDLAAVNLQGQIRPGAHLPGYYGILDVSSDGQILTLNDEFKASLFVGVKDGAPPQDLYWHDNSVIRDLSADGKQILFSEGGAAAGTDWMTYMRSTDGAPAVRLGEGFGTAFSPDGKFAMVNPAGPQAPLLALPTRAGETRTLTSDTRRHLTGRWTGKGGQIVYAGSEPGGATLRYYVQDGDGAAARPVSEGDLDFDRGDPIVLSPDGSLLAMGIVGQGLRLQPLAGGPARPVPGNTVGFAPLAWCEGNSLLTYQRGEIPARITRVDLLSGKQEPWAELVPSNGTALTMVGPIRIASNCRDYGYTAQYNPSRLVLVRDFTLLRH